MQQSRHTQNSSDSKTVTNCEIITIAIGTEFLFYYGSCMMDVRVDDDCVRNCVCTRRFQI